MRAPRRRGRTRNERGSRSSRFDSRAERVAHPRPETLAAIDWDALLHRRELIDELLLLFGEALGRPKLDAHVQVARATSVHARQAATAQVEHLSALRPGGNCQHDRARHRWHTDLATK